MEITLQGNLRFFHVPEIFHFLSYGNKSGTLNLQGDSRQVFIYFQAGSVVYATSDETRFRLSSILLKRRRIDDRQWKVIEGLMDQQREKFGRIAVEQGILSEDELVDFLKIQASEIIYDCFLWQEGQFSFLDVDQVPPYAVLISVDVTDLLMEGARRIDEVQLFSRLLPPGSSVLKMADPQAHERLSLTLDEWKIVFLINGKRSIDEILRQSHVDSIEVYQLLYGLLVNKIIEPLSEEHSQSWKAELNHPVSAFRRPDSMSSGDKDLLISSEAKLSYHDVLKVTLARLTLEKPDLTGETFALVEQEYTIGRQLGNHIHIPDPSISNVHARIFKGPEGYVIEDLNSRNGTFINGQRVDRKLLHDNDAVRLGNTFLVYNIVYEVKQVT